ncbi:hypothetical protein UA08_07465 [Talaromyces atroroseus]|uniref:Histone deacetylase complex subunit SAP30 Sin3 binding domain-containing protein n=1 Tax=Talaromyces atroroseus TaxID=1441469 RepID=A0A225ANG4_TALAT|nr:hypothetical protein UA08_07465 [Talaromyces atroroseus]OKL57139.1 hypothetical protein UA08_07465 [Talaromyces atroroseus]
MAPPRQRPATTVAGNTIDDSRSEASSSTLTGHQSRGVPGPKPRKVGVAGATGSSATSKELKVAAATGAAAGIGGGVVEYGDVMRDELPGIPWPQMPLSILHDYRHAYKLSTPSAYARPISKIMFAAGIGYRSPTAIAARKATSSTSSSSSSSSSKVLHKINSQDRVGKEQLALAVRKHFNAAGLVEQDAIARFLYKVREEGKGREFRLRFQP